MLPFFLLKTAQGHPMLVELKNGETYNGHLVNCDTWMNIHLREVICTSKDGDRFWYIPKCYVRGNTIKYFQLTPSLGRGRARGREEAEEGLAEVETEVQDEDEVEADLNN